MPAQRRQIVRSPPCLICFAGESSVFAVSTTGIGPIEDAKAKDMLGKIGSVRRRPPRRVRLISVEFQVDL
ncbi:MAG: hypothetical protein IPK83_18570 [Planctomycetes bacterium]|nr:hypothetical protein [Planctomycetota bacterium]